MVRGQHQVDRLGLRLGDQLDKTQLIKVAGEQKVPAPMRKGAWGQTEFQVNLKLGLTLRCHDITTVPGYLAITPA